MHASRHDAIVFGLQPRPLIVGHGVLSQIEGLKNLAFDRMQVVDEILYSGHGGDRPREGRLPDTKDLFSP